MLDHPNRIYLCGIFLALSLFCRQMPGTCASLWLDPQIVVVRIGSPVSVICSTNVSNAIMGWETSEGIVSSQENSQNSTWSVAKLTHWDINPMCYINGEKQSFLNLNITIYKPPDQVSLRTVNDTGPMIEGKQYKLQCDVQNVAPIRLLTVNWYKGQHLLTSESFSNNTKLPGNTNSTLQISPQRDDDGVQYRCEAELNLGPEGPQPHPIVTSDPLNITVHFGPHVSNCPDHVLLKEGQNLSSLCKVEGNPLPLFFWEKEEGLRLDPAIPLDRFSSGLYTFIIVGHLVKSLSVEVMYGPDISCVSNYTVQEGTDFVPNCTVSGYPLATVNWYEVDENDMDEIEVDFPKIMYRSDAGRYILIASSNHSTVNYTMEIDVFYPPSEISELESENVHSGDYVVLKCSSQAKPRPRYKWIYHDAHNVFIEDQDGVSLLRINHANGENIGTYMCIASNYLGETTQTVRVDVQGVKAACLLTVKPEHAVLEYGESINVQCTSTEPTAKLRWKIAENVYNTSTLVINSSLITNWNTKASCHGSFLGLDDCHKDVNVTIYKRPDKVFISILDHNSTMIENTTYAIQCYIKNVSSFFRVNWYKGQDVVNSTTFNEAQNPVTKNVTLKISPERNDNKMFYTCEAELLGLGNDVKVMSESVNITVHYKPTITSKLQQLMPLFHGYPVNLVCNASSVPAPNVTWIFNNEEYEGGNLTVTSPGDYTCIAKNYVGNDTRVVKVVLEDSSCKLVLNPPELLVEYGTSASVDCSTTTPSTLRAMGWNASQGAVDMMKNVQLITWKVDTLVHWDIQPVCFLKTLAGLCQVKLPVTVYNLPDQASISIVGHTGPLIEGKVYELQCDINNVAPVHLLTVNWYKGQHLVAKTLFSDFTKTPVNQSTRFHMSPSRTDDGIQYRCEAELRLSGMRAGTQIPSKVASQVLGLTVHYSPQFSSVVEIFNETTKDIVLNCTVMANPPPKYIWHLTSLGKELNTDHPVLYLSSLGLGNYTCTASNRIGSISKLFIVQVNPGGMNRTTFWAIIGPFVGLAVMMILGYVLGKMRTVKK